MMRNVLTEAELKALLGDDEPAPPAAAAAHAAWDMDERKLLHALVRNQLRLLQMIEEMQAELRMLKAVAAARGEEAGGGLRSRGNAPGAPGAPPGPPPPF